MRRLYLLLVSAVLLLVGAGPAGAQVYVTPGGGIQDPKNGSDWDHAISASELAQRLGWTAVVPDPGSAEFWLKAGSYPELHLHKGTALYGGFDGTEKTREARDPSKN